MFELSARLVGIYKVDNQTRSIAIGASLVFAYSLLSFLTLFRLFIDNTELAEIPNVEDDGPDAVEEDIEEEDEILAAAEPAEEEEEEDDEEEEEDDS
jgi:hypothetical protein